MSKIAIISFSSINLRIHKTFYIIYLFKGLWDNPIIIYLRSCETVKTDKEPQNYLFEELWTVSNCSTGNLAHCCRENGEYRAMQNGLCTAHYQTAQNEQVVAN